MSFTNAPEFSFWELLRLGGKWKLSLEDDAKEWQEKLDDNELLS